MTGVERCGRAEVEKFAGDRAPDPRGLIERVDRVAAAGSCQIASSPKRIDPHRAR